MKGVSDSLGYPRCNLKPTVPHLPPPKSWTPSPPFPPAVPVPPINPHFRSSEFPDVHCTLEAMNTQVGGSHGKKELIHGPKGRCNHCGTVKLCPAQLRTQLEKLQANSNNCIRLTATNNAYRKTLKPPHNTPNVKNKKIISRNINNVNANQSIVIEAADYEDCIARAPDKRSELSH